MFSGIVACTGSVVEARHVPGGIRLRIAAGALEAAAPVSLHTDAQAAERTVAAAARPGEPAVPGAQLHIAPGASVCVSGVCLTVAGVTGATLDFDVITETLDRTTLGSLAPGDRVNLERSLSVGDAIDGHFVQGHVDGRATVTHVQASPREHVIRLRPEPHLRPFIVPKGSIAVDGVSLTVAALAGDAFSIALIPTTLERTTLAALSPGRRVNIETDVIVRTIVHHLTATVPGDGVTLAKLQAAGFA
ncbi:MAG: riboflavin synthase [Phycisphaerae bacterium]